MPLQYPRFIAEGEVITGVIPTEEDKNSSDESKAEDDLSHECDLVGASSNIAKFTPEQLELFQTRYENG